MNELLLERGIMGIVILGLSYGLIKLWNAYQELSQEHLADVRGHSTQMVDLTITMNSAVVGYTSQIKELTTIIKMMNRSAP